MFYWKLFLFNVSGRVIFLVFLTVVSSPAFATDPLKSLAQKLKEDLTARDVHASPSFAVLDFMYSKGRMSTGSYLVSERLVTYLVQTGAFVVERRLIEKILEEKKFWETGVVNMKSTGKYEKLLGVEAVVVGTLSDVSDDNTEVVARVIKVDTAQVLAVGSAVVKRLWHDLPKIPRAAQMQALAPVVCPIGGGPTESVMENRPTLSGVDSTDHRQRYYPAPVPFFIPSSSHRLGEENLK